MWPVPHEIDRDPPTPSSPHQLQSGELSLPPLTNKIIQLGGSSTLGPLKKVILKNFKAFFDRQIGKLYKLQINNSINWLGKKVVVYQQIYWDQFVHLKCFFCFLSKDTKITINFYFSTIDMNIQIAQCEPEEKTTRNRSKNPNSFLKFFPRIFLSSKFEPKYFCLYWPEEN